MENCTNSALYKIIEWMTPSLVKATVKRVFWKMVRLYNRCRYIKKGRFFEFGYRFRFDQRCPYRAYIGERTITEDFNTWNAEGGI
jgi:hypothetical protein